MNPFDLSGPAFLLFFGLLVVVVAGILWMVRVKMELSAGRGHPEHPLTDPYKIACLRGGKNELIRVATVSLIDRRLLSITADTIVTSELGRKTVPRRSIEKHLLYHCMQPVSFPDLFATSAFDADAAEYESDLRRRGLLPDDEITSMRRMLFGAGMVIIALTAATKIVVAIWRGRANVFFLFFAALIAIGILNALTSPRLTALGQSYMAELRNLFKSLRLRAALIRAGGSTGDAAMLAAVYGVPALTSVSFAWTQRVFPRAQSSSFSVTSCGSSCGTACGSSCGGGCGGGCGGCGG